MAQLRAHRSQSYIRSRHLIEPENARAQARKSYPPQALGHREVQCPKIAERQQRSLLVALRADYMDDKSCWKIKSPHAASNAGPAAVCVAPSKPPPPSKCWNTGHVASGWNSDIKASAADVMIAQILP